MTKFEVGDRVEMPGVPLTVVVTEVGTCNDGPGCPLGGEVFQFDDPGGLGPDWMHSSEFELATAPRDSLNGQVHLVLINDR